MPPKPTFEQALSNLVSHLRVHPDGHAKTRRLLRSVSGKIARASVVIDAGIEHEHTLLDEGLVGRMHHRRIETIEVNRGAPAEELLELARALARDDGPIPETEDVRVSHVVDVTPGDQPAPPTPLSQDREIPMVVDHESNQDRAPRLGDGPGDEMTRLTLAITESYRRGSLTESLHAAQALIQLCERAATNERRLMAIAARRVMAPDLLRDLVEHAVRTPEEQPRILQLLEWTGGNAAEVVIDALAATESVGPREFLCDLGASLPDAVPMVEALLRSHEWHRVRLGVELMGRRADPRSGPALAAQLLHRNRRVRLAAVGSLARIAGSSVIEPLLRALDDDAVSVRLAAADALAGRSSRGVIMGLAQALDRERDSRVRRALIEALGRVGTEEAVSVLVRVATTRRSILNRKGYAAEHRLAAVAALASCGARSRGAALEQLASGSRGAVAQAARQALAE